MNNITMCAVSIQLYTVLPCYFIQDVLPNTPSYFILVEIHKLLISIWYVPSSAVPAADQASFVFPCASFVESYGAAPEKMSLS